MGKRKAKESKDQPKINIIWAEGLNDKDLKILREQVELAMRDPDYSIVANYEIHWDQIPVNENLLARIVWTDHLDAKDTEVLKEQVDRALVDPNYAIVTNYEVHWNEISK